MIEYLQRTRDYYGAQGYTPYQWAHFDQVPFCAPTQPLNQAKIVLISTAAPYREGLGDQGPGAAYNAKAKFFDVFTQPISPVPDLRISHIGYDRIHCAADDPNTWLPVRRLQALQQAGVIGEVAEELIGIPTNRSQRVTMEQDAPAAAAHCQRLGATHALLVPT